MSSINISPNMNLPIPVPGQESGPQYAIDINNCMSIIDAHNHAGGYGVQITPAGLNINSDLPISNNNLLLAKSVTFTPQGSPLGVGANQNALYVSGVDLFYNDNGVNQIRITQNGSVVGSAGNINGLPSGTASASYVSGTGTFVFQSATNTAADVDGRSLILRNAIASSNGLTLSAPASLGFNYGITLPLPPSTPSFVTMDASGVQSATIPIPSLVTQTQLTAATVIRGYSRLSTGVGNGSSATGVRHYTAILDVGTALTGATDTTNGGTITVNEDGIYMIGCNDQADPSLAMTMRITVDSTVLTTSEPSYAQGLITQLDVTANKQAQLTWTMMLFAGQVIRAQNNGNFAPSTTPFAVLWAVKINN